MKELSKKEVAERYVGKIEESWKEWDGREEGSIEEEWEFFKECVKKGAEQLYGTKVLGVKARRNEWWDEEFNVMIEEK